MSGPQFMPFYVGDYLRDTMHLTTEQHGAYLLLLFACWTHEGRLPNNDAELAAITRMPIDEWRRAKHNIGKFFKISVKFWSQKRIDVELERAQHLHDVRSKAGSKGGSKTQARARVPQPDILNNNLEEEPHLRPRARARSVKKEKGRNGVLTDIKAKQPSPATPERSWTPVSRAAPRQPSNAKANLQSKIARWLEASGQFGEVGNFWAAMMGPDAQQTLDRAAAAMKASGWKDRG